MSGWWMLSILLLCCAAAHEGAETFQEQQRAVISANQLLEQGEWKEAVSLYRQLVDADGSLAPVGDELDRARILANLALAYRTGSRFDLALQASHRAAKAAPFFADAHFGAGLALTALGRDREAATSFKEAVAAATESPRAGSVDAAEATVMMADALVKAGEQATARAALAALTSGSEETLRSAARALAALGDEQGAHTLRRRAAAAAAAAAASSSTTTTVTAASSAQAAQHREYRGSVGTTRSEGAALMEAEGLMEAGRAAAAAAVLEAALAHSPASFHLRGSLALALTVQGKHAEAIPHLERAAALQAGDAVTWARLVFARAAVCDWRGRPAELRALQAALARGEDCESGLKGDCVEPLLALYLPLSPLLSTDISRRACACVARSVLARPLPLPSPRLALPALRRVRVAYVSSDFRAHATAYLARSLWAHHDPRAVLAAVFMTITPPDAAHEPYWHHIARTAHEAQVLGGLSDWEVAGRLNAWGAEVLVDMNGWVRGERAAALALRPARAQVHYMAYLHSLGCAHVDWLVSDRLASPPDLAPAYAEPLLLLPSSFLVTDHRQMAPPHWPPPPPPSAAPAPSSLGAAWRRSLNLSAHTGAAGEEGGAIAGGGGGGGGGGGDGGVVVGSLQALYKVSPASFRLWLRVLAAAPAAVLWLQRWDEAGLRNLRAAADAMGLAPPRLLASAPPPTRFGAVWNAHAAAAHLHLDTLEYNAVTLATDLLWLPVPSLTLPGERMCARVGASLSAAARAPWLVARDPADFVELAVQLAVSPARLARARARLEEARASSELFDTARWVQGWERALRLARELRGGGAAAEEASFHIVVAAVQAQA